MIDKLEVSTSDFAITEEAIFRIWPASYESNEEDELHGGVLYQQNGRYLYGAKAGMNRDTFNITIKPGFGMQVIFNPAVVIHKNNFLQVNEDEFHKSIDIIEAELVNNGVHLDLDSANITRLDIAQDRDMQEPIPVYFQLFRMLKAKRAKPKECSDGYYLQNGNRTLLFYDKVQEMLFSKKDVSAIQGRNILRGEYRLLRKDAVRRAGFTDIASIRRTSFNDLANYYKASVSDFAFTVIPSPDEFAYSLKTEIEILSEFKSRYARNALARYHEARTNLDRFGSIENYRTSLLAAGFDRAYIFRHIKEVIKCIALINEVEGENGKKNIGTLYQEMYEAFIKAAA